MKILIYAFPKTGSTILTYRVASALNAQVIFEPRGLRRPQAEKGEHVVTKALVGAIDWTQVQSYRDYDKKIWLARDPRDVAVSRCLYQFWKGHQHTSEAAVLLEQLRRKVENPRSIPFYTVFRSITKIFDSLEKHDRERYPAALRELQRCEERWFTLRYESMIDGDYLALKQYLGFDVDQTAEVPERLSRVRRTKGYGDWRNWFTPEDADFFRPIYQPYMDFIGYTDDWQLADHPWIDPRHSVEYLKAIAA